MYQPFVKVTDVKQSSQILRIHESRWIRPVWHLAEDLGEWKDYETPGYSSGLVLYAGPPIMSFVIWNREGTTNRAQLIIAGRMLVAIAAEKVA